MSASSSSSLPVPRRSSSTTHPTGFDPAAIAKRVHHVLATTYHEGEPELDKIAQLIRTEAGTVLSDVDVLAVLRQLRYDSVGIGVLESVLGIKGVTDIVVNGAQQVWFDRGNGMEKSTVTFENDQHVRQLATRLLVAAGRRLDDAQCYADGQITRDDGTNIRVHAIISPPALNGTCLSLRVLRQADATLPGLVRRGTLSDGTAACVTAMMVAQRSFIVVGGTGSGKTTLLSALIGEVDPTQRIVCIEDTAELRPTHPHVVNLIVKANNAEGRGAVTMSDLLKQSLRMRPDRIVVGEIRGEEVIDLLASLNTGHDGCAGTVHANSLDEVPARLEALAAYGGMGRDALISQLAAARPVVLVMKRTRTGRRVLHQIGVLGGVPTTITTLWDHEHDTNDPVIDWAVV